MAGCDEVVHIRRARQTDARGIAQVRVETWRAAYDELLPKRFLDGLSVDQSEQRWAQEMRVLPADRQPWVAETHERIVGFVIGGPARDDTLPMGTGEVYAIYVLPDCWERGVGRSLLSHVERDLAGHGYDQAVLWVLADNARARYFYESAGWQLDGASKVDTIGGIEVSEVRYRITLEKSRVAETS